MSASEASPRWVGGTEDFRSTERISKRRRPGSGRLPARDINARLTEVARRYAWQAEQRRGALSSTRRITLIRMRELERIFEVRYGRYLPDDDAGREDAEILAHHIAQLRGEVTTHIQNWLRMWAPWMREAEAKALIARVSSRPLKFTSDNLGGRLRLTMAERKALDITTIGSHELTKAQRAELRKRKKAEAERERRRRRAEAEGRTLRPKRGRPPKNSCTAGRD
jgi:hypothetical protein